MLSLTNGKIAFDFSKCQQCGTCLAVCPTHSIHALQLKNGLTDIKINQDTCIQCKKCIKSCPSTMKDNTEQYNESLRRNTISQIMQINKFVTVLHLEVHARP